MSFQNDMHTYLSEQLNDNTLGLPFSLYYKFNLAEFEFVDFVFNSTDWTDTGVGAENNVIVEYEGTEYNTQLGEYTITEAKYIPCIIQSFEGEFQPYNFLKQAFYTIPLTFYLDEVWNRDNNDIFTEAIEEFQDTIRGLVETISGKKVLINHSDVKPITGLIDFNGKFFREYQIVIFADTIENGYFGNEIEYYVTHPDLFEGETTRIHPIARDSNRAINHASFQEFSTATNFSYEVKNIPDLSSFSIELSLPYIAGDEFEFVQFLTDARYADDKSVRSLQLLVKYPNGTQYSNKYLIEQIGGPEQIGSLIYVTAKFRPVSTKYGTDGVL